MGSLNSPPPLSPPPNFFPTKTQALNKMELSIDNIINKYAYIWLKDRAQFWTWITFAVGERIGGWRWNGFIWDNFEIDISKVDSIVIYRYAK